MTVTREFDLCRCILSLCTLSIINVFETLCISRFWYCTLKKTRICVRYTAALVIVKIYFLKVLLFIFPFKFVCFCIVLFVCVCINMNCVVGLRACLSEDVPRYRSVSSIFYFLRILAYFCVLSEFGLCFASVHCILVHYVFKF